ncbi:fungal-specific transcription factor domain-containing protein [Irpex rosettiformis]|uniref:Fungal-specific transcription factor domain-containing protein n=1 Tax=Irpex rosettiformis TaxID=378272 RepID=A0ACB8TN11_9APHY|nr:fungal-specific transcription factor domain-containing protein [Irpex rosettiformis]
MKDDKKVLKTTSGRGTYARQACNHCRRRKSKCDGHQPVCGPCRDSGRADECTWGRETAKKARTQQHFESLVNHIKSLEHRVKELESELARSHNGRSGSVSDAARSVPSSSISPHASPITKFEPDEDGLPNGDHEDGEDSSAESDGESEIDQLIAPTRHLVLQGEDLELYGPTSAYRLAPERAKDPPCTNGVIPEHPSPSPVLDWSRYLPPSAPLTRAEHDRLLDLLFRFCTSWCFRVIPQYFYRDMQRVLLLPPGAPAPKTSHYSPMLHNAMLALATAFSDDPAVLNIEFRRHFAGKAKSYIDVDVLQPNVCTVSALGLMATFHSSRGEQSLGYLYAGMSGRMTQALGLQIDCSAMVKSARIKESDMLNRNWAYWATFCQDVCWSLYIGRDCALSAPKDKELIPVPFVDSEFDHEQWMWEPSNLPAQKSNVAGVFAATCELLRIARRVMDFVNGLSTDFKHPNLQQVSELDIELNAWKDSLSPEVDLTAATRPSALPHRLSVHLMFWWLFILLHRPFYRRTKGATADIDHVKLCNRAAENMMLLLGIWHTNYNLRYVSTTHVQFTFSAGTVFVLSAIQAISGPRLGRVTLASSLSQIETCLEYLTIIGRSWETAECAREILLNFFDETLKPRLLLRGGDANFKFELPNAHRARTSSIVTAAQQQQQQQQQQVSRRSKLAQFSAASSSSSSSVVVASSSTLPSLNDLQYFPTSGVALGWPLMHPTDYSHSNLPSPTTVDSNAYTHRSPPQQPPQQPQQPSSPNNANDMDLDVGYHVGMNMTMATDIPGAPGPTNNASVDMMSFGVPELGVGYQFDPSTAPASLEFSEEELAIMDQICRQQGTTMVYPGHIGLQAG